MIAYLTYNDAPSGVYKSQVIDVIKYMNQLSDHKILLIAFVSIRNYRIEKKKLKNWYQNSIVLPSFPGIKNWEKNQFLINLILRRKGISKVINRGIFAFHFSLKAKNKGIIKEVIFDGRGTYSGEWKEFDFGAPEVLKKQIFDLEKQAVTYADQRIAVSYKLIENWKHKFNYNGSEGEDHFVIPCTLSADFEQLNISEQNIKEKRRELSIPEDACVLIYAGSVAGWQSIDDWLLEVKSIMDNNPNLYLLLMTNETATIKSFIEDSKGKAQRIFVNPKEVPGYLVIGDYGILIRKPMETNEVASPTKFAEYLACGLKVLISEGIGDYSKFAEENECGFLIKENSDLNKVTLKKLSSAEKEKLIELSKNNFLKKVYKTQYLNILDHYTH